MRPVLFVPLIIIAPFILFSLLGTVTGDAMSAVVLGLIVVMAAVAWLAGAPVDRGAVPEGDRAARI
jgi:hypothetical protein